MNRQEVIKFTQNIAGAFQGFVTNENVFGVWLRYLQRFPFELCDQALTNYIVEGQTRAPAIGEIIHRVRTIEKRSALVKTAQDMRSLAEDLLRRIKRGEAPIFDEEHEHKVYFLPLRECYTVGEREIAGVRVPVYRPKLHKIQDHLTAEQYFKNIGMYQADRPRYLEELENWFQLCMTSNLPYLEQDNKPIDPAVVKQFMADWQGHMREKVSMEPRP
jgi:hypothetical protein